MAPLPEDIFNDALALPIPARAAFLKAACRGDADLYRQLDHMLQIAEESPGLVAEPNSRLIPEVLGHYELLEEIGRGGMGVVFRARDTHLERIVALKVLQAPLSGVDRATRRFAKEARLLAALTHDNIATLYAFETHADMDFLTMELIEGRSLAEHLHEGPLTLEETLELGGQLCDALAEAHRRDIVHLDLKPDNIMITPNERIKVLDFGIARALDREPSAKLSAARGTVGTLPGGTPAYMAPEQMAGGPIDARADLWAFGCILYECLTGRRLPESPEAKRRQLSLEVPRDIPHEIDTLIDQCVSVDPADRPGSAREIGRRLARFSRHRARCRSALLYGICAALLVALTVVVTKIPIGPRPTLVGVEITANDMLKGIDADGETIWARQLPDHLAKNVTPNEFPPHIYVDATEPSAVFLATWRQVLNLSPETGETIWAAPIDWQSPINAQDDPLFHQFCWIPGSAGREPRILAGITDGIWYGSALQILGLEGTTVGHYYHPGRINKCYAMDLGPGEASWVLLVGSNSSARFVRDLVPFETDYHPGFAALIDPLTISGQAFPYARDLPEDRDWPGMPQAVEQAYLLVPPLHPDCGPALNAAKHVRHPYGEQTITLRTQDGRVYTCSPDLVPLSCYIRLDTAADSLRTTGEARFLPLLHLESGRQTWHDVPIVE